MSDPQSDAFRDAGPDDWDETKLVDKPDGTLDSLGPDEKQRCTVDEYDTDGWDVERVGPKTLDEARENLAARIADPAAPDTPAEIRAYHGEDE